MKPETPSPKELAALQSRFQQAISQPSGIEEESARLGDSILPSKALSAADRLAVYRQAYFARLLGCMRELFPALHFTLGDEAFDAIALGYLQQHPSTSYSLGHLATRFPEYLEATRPADQEPTSHSWADFVVDLARLEWTIDEVFDGPGDEEETGSVAERLRSIAPEAWPDVRLQVARSMRFLELGFPLAEYYSAARAGREAGLPAASPSYLIVWRRNYVVRRWEIESEAFFLLHELAGGERLSVALERVAQKCDDDTAFAAQIPTWFRDWGAAGIIVDVKS